MICNSPPPENIEVNQDRDCDKLAAVLIQRYPNEFSSIEKAEEFVTELRQKKWD